MEKECSKCLQKFHTTHEDATVCPSCLRSEFTVKATVLDDNERAELAAEYKESIKRQSARAESFNGVYASGTAFSVAGKLRFALGLVIFLVCCFLFLVSDRENGIKFLIDLDMESQRLFSMILCVVSAVLVASSSVRFKVAVRLLALVIAAVGWFLPDMLAAALRAKQVATVALPESAPGKPETPDKTGPSTEPVMTEEDLQVFYTLRSSSHRISHYAVFMDNQDSRARALVREALNRLLEAEYTRAYTRANGALYVIVNAPGERRSISALLSRFGTVTHADISRGVYEVRFDADRANLVSQYSPDVLSSPLNSSYVTANLSELRCLDPMRVRMSARSLAGSNVRVLRREIRDTLVEVLQDPWTTEPDTYSALIDALVTYCGTRDAAATQLCLKYFEARRALHRDASPEVTMYLIREVPDAMVNPILDLWCENPIAWTDMLNQLGYRVQAPLVERLTTATNIRVISTILKYFEERGTPEALPAVEPFLEHSDSIIRHSARTAQSALLSRQK